MSNLVIRILVILIFTPFVGFAMLVGWLEFNERQLIRSYYAEREILRAVHSSTNDLKRSGDARTDSEAAKEIQRRAFLREIPAGTDRETVYRRLATEDMSCVPESKNKTEAHCMAIGHSNDFRWYFILRFSAKNELLDAEIRTLKGA